jgi:hypothetical protein
MLLATTLRWPWLPPAVAIALLAVAGQVGRGWLLGTVGCVVLAGVAVAVALMRDGRRVHTLAAQHVAAQQAAQAEAPTAAPAAVTSDPL